MNLWESGTDTIHSQHPITPAPFVEKAILELLVHRCQKSVGRYVTGQFLCSLFCPLDLCASLCQYHTALITVTMY